jgi:4-amino-4-deoxy-L-arabinose transferase-like glycosyltransferase
MTWRAVGLGVLIGVAYTLSPLFIVVAAGFALLLRSARRISRERERRILTMLLAAAILLRIAAIGGLFMATDYTTAPFGSFFGDEDYFIKRSIWLRNIALGIPVSLADVLYAYDQSIQTSLVWYLATLHLLFGPSPYGVHLVSAFVYVAGAYALYRTVRPAFGPVASVGGLALLLFLPSLFVWSISVLKEPVFFALLAGAVSLTMAAARRGGWAPRAGAALALVLLAVVAETLREGGLMIAGAATAAGALFGALTSRPRIAAALAIVALATTPWVLAQTPVRDRVGAAVARAAARHWDHVHEPGHSYMVLEPAFYVDRPQPGVLSSADTTRLALGGVAAYAIVPLPWQMTSRSELAYLPEQIAWYGLLLLLPAGIVTGLRRDPFLTALLAVHLAVAVMLVAVTSGNIGTLVRHRSLALPYAVWFSGLGACTLLARLGTATATGRAITGQQGVEG